MAVERAEPTVPESWPPPHPFFRGDPSNDSVWVPSRSEMSCVKRWVVADRPPPRSSKSLFFFPGPSGSKLWHNSLSALLPRTSRLSPLLLHMTFCFTHTTSLGVTGQVQDQRHKKNWKGVRDGRSTTSVEVPCCLALPKVSKIGRLIPLHGVSWWC